MAIAFRSAVDLAAAQLFRMAAEALKLRRVASSAGAIWARPSALGRDALLGLGPDAVPRGRFFSWR